jgi:NADH-quinone oxidoreductase subunit M
MYFLISIWGSGRREYSAMKFVLYTITGSALMLAGFLALAFSTDTFDMVKLQSMDLAAADLIVPLPLIFGLVLAAFAVKLPVFPLHTWLPDAHTDAPTAVSVMLAGVLLKMGGYGILRINFGIMPSVAADAAVWLAAFAAVNVIYGALVTMRQTDLKRLIAYSSVSHMGYVLLGAAALGQVGVTGAAMQMMTHGAITGMLFVMVGLMYERTHTRQIEELGGLAKQMPFIAVFMLVASLASLGLPAMAGFVAEFIIFSGAYDEHPIATLFGIFGVVLSAGYLLWTMQRVFYGPPKERWDGLTDATAWWERAPVVLLAASIVVVGVYPSFLVDIISDGVEPIVGRLG